MPFQNIEESLQIALQYEQEVNLSVRQASKKVRELTERNEELQQ